MFFLWVNIIKIKKTNNIYLMLLSTISSGEIEVSAVFFINVITNTVKVANIEDREEYLKINKTVIHVNTNKKNKL